MFSYLHLDRFALLVLLHSFLLLSIPVSAAPLRARQAPQSVTTVHTTNTPAGPVTETCVVVLTPIKDVQGNDAFREVKTCTVTMGAASPPPPNPPNGSSSSTTSQSSTSTTAASSSTASTSTSSTTASTTSSTTSGTATSTSSTTSGTVTSTSSTSSATASGSGAVVVIGVTSVPVSTTTSSQGSRSTTSSSAATTTTAGSGGSPPIVVVGVSTVSGPATTASSSSTASTTSTSTSATTSTTATAGAASGTAQAVESPTSSNFAFPGKKLSVLPIGLGVFAGISVIALIVVGLVTYERTKYRKAFRQRKLAESGAAMGYGGNMA